MTLVIKINSVDRTSDIEQGSLVLDVGSLSKEPTTLSFTMKGVKTMPNLNDTIELIENGIKIMAGTITDKSEELIGNIMPKNSYTATDGFFQFDRQLVVKAYSDNTAKEIVQDIIDNFTTGFTLNMPDASPEFKTARFNYEQPSRALQKIADNIGWDWYIDENNVVQFFPPESFDAPFDVTDTNGKAIISSLEFTRNVTELRNTVYVRGGEFDNPISEADSVDKYQGNGEDNTFPLVYRYSNVQVSVNEVAQTVGVDFIDQLISGQVSTGSATSTFANQLRDSGATFQDDGVVAGDQVFNSTDDTYAKVVSVDSQIQLTLNQDIMTSGENYVINSVNKDCLYNFQEKLIRFPNGSIANGDVVRVYGDAKLPVIVQAIDPDSIATYGKREGIEINKSINSIEEAETLAYSLIEKWRDGSLEGVFRTRETGLRVGQSITINSVLFGVNETYKINSIQGRMDGYDRLQYTVEFIKSGQTQLVDILIGLIGQSNENIEISPDEILQIFRQLDDEFSMTDEIVEVIKNSPPYHYAPVTLGNEGKYNFATYT